MSDASPDRPLWSETSEAHLSHARMLTNLARYAESIPGLEGLASEYRRAAAERWRAAAEAQGDAEPNKGVTFRRSIAR